MHDLKLHQVKHDGDGIKKFVVMARVCIVAWNNISKINVALINCLISRLSTRNEFLLPWVIFENDGSILSAHCTYMAG